MADEKINANFSPQRVRKRLIIRDKYFISIGRCFELGLPSATIWENNPLRRTRLELAAICGANFSRYEFSPPSG